MTKTIEQLSAEFDAIKDKKTKGAKKLGTLSDILTSVYAIDLEIASNMWSYLVELNASDGPASSKYFVAQVFNKMTSILDEADAARLLAMDPKRVELFVMQGYVGSNLWKYFTPLIRGLIEADMSLQACDFITWCLRKIEVDGDGPKDESRALVRNEEPDNQECLIEQRRLVRKACAVCEQYILADSAFAGEMRMRSDSPWASKAPETFLGIGMRFDLKSDAPKGHGSTAFQVLQALSETNPEEGIAFIVNSTILLSESGLSPDFDALFAIASICKEPDYYLELLWAAKDSLDEDELRAKWEEMCLQHEEGDPAGSVDFSDDFARAKGKSKRAFYTNLAISSDIISDYCFRVLGMGDQITNGFEGLFETLVFRSEWERATRYLVQSLLNSQHSSSLDILKYKPFALANDIIRSFDDESYKWGTDRYWDVRGKAEPYANMLLDVIDATTELPEHDDLVFAVKPVVESLTDNALILGRLKAHDDFGDQTAEEMFKQYAKRAVQRGTGSISSDSRFELLMDALRNDGLSFECGGDEVTTAFCLRMAQDESVAQMFFAQLRGRVRERTQLLSACIRCGDVERALALVDLMSTTTDTENYDKPKGWGKQNGYTIFYLIEEYGDDSLVGPSSKHEGVTPQMRQMAGMVAERAIPLLPEELQRPVGMTLYKVRPDQIDEEQFVNGVLTELELAVVPKKKRKEKLRVHGLAPEMAVRNSYPVLAKIGRLDVVGHILMRFHEEQTAVRITSENDYMFNSEMHGIFSRLSKEDVCGLLARCPEVFEAWFDDKYASKDSIQRLLNIVNYVQNRELHESLVSLILSHKCKRFKFDLSYKSFDDILEII